MEFNTNYSSIYSYESVHILLSGHQSPAFTPYTNYLLYDTYIWCHQLFWMLCEILRIRVTIILNDERNIHTKYLNIHTKYFLFGYHEVYLSAIHHSCIEYILFFKYNIFYTIHTYVPVGTTDRIFLSLNFLFMRLLNLVYLYHIHCHTGYIYFLCVHRLSLSVII